MRILLTGASGQLGTAVAAAAPPGAELRAATRSELDITDAAKVHVAVSAYRPDLVINAAAYTGVDAAENDPASAHAVNTLGPRHLAAAVRTQQNCRLLHVSTDYVFDGNASAPYLIDAAVNPTSVYGRSKRLGEIAVLELLPERGVIVRTAWLYSHTGHNFLLTMLRRMRGGEALRVVADQTGTPTAAVSVARALWRLTELPQVHGVLHWTDAGETSWHGFAAAIAEEATDAGLLTTHPQVKPISTAEYPTPARRPAYSVLDTRTSAATLGLTPVPWRRNVHAVVSQLATTPSKH